MMSSVARLRQRDLELYVITQPQGYIYNLERGRDITVENGLRFRFLSDGCHSLPIEYSGVVVFCSTASHL